MKTRPVVSDPELIPAILQQGYHTIYALAELIDNSVQAEAEHIEILCMDDLNIDTNKRRLKEIAIVDDGVGMSQNDLWDSIRLGKSQSRGKGGIGRFGVGLTHATFSQCRRIDVYSWKKPNEIFHIHLDLDLMTTEMLVEEPIKNQIPDKWKKISNHLSKSGTIVIWSKINRCRWKKSETLIHHSELTIGRIYRKFLTDKKNKLKIHMISFNNDSGTADIDHDMQPNDPLYLISPSSTPKPWDKKPMFQPDGERWEEKIPIKGSDGNEHDVITRYSFVRKAAREVEIGKAGSKNFGKHAANNIGVSIIRAKRELGLDTSLLISYEPSERWWGVEIEFPPILDDIFGVSTNKQVASELAYVMKEVGKQNREERYRKDLTGEEDNPLYDLVNVVSNRLSSLRSSIRKQKIKPTSGPTPEPPVTVPPAGGPTVTGTQLTSMTEKERQKAIQEFIMQKLGIDIDDWSPGDKLRFEFGPLNGSQLFDVSLVGGVKIITINVNHKAYKYLLTMLLHDQEIDPNDAVKLLHACAKGFQKLFAAWAGLEDKELNPSERDRLADVRYHWGEELQKYFEIDQE